MSNKCDRKDAAAVSTEEGRQLAAAHGAVFVECSAQAPLRIEDIFLHSTNGMVEKSLVAACSIGDKEAVVALLAQQGISADVADMVAPFLQLQFLILCLEWRQAAACCT